MSPVLETERLLLRELTTDDVDNLLGIFSDPIPMRYYPATKNRAETTEWIEWNLRSYKEYGHGLWAVIRKDTLGFAGQCGLVMQRDIDGADEVEIGYLFLRGQWNHGFATEAAIGCRQFAYRSIQVDRLVSLIHPDNVASQRVAEKVGMAFEKVIERRGNRVHLYGLRRSPHQAADA